MPSMPRPKGRTPQAQFVTAQTYISQSKGRSAILNLSPLRKLAQLPSEIADLETIEIVFLGNTRITDLGPLSKLPALRSLHLNNTPISNLTPLSTLPKLELLRLDRTLVTSITPLVAIQTLEALHLDYTQITDIKDLENIPSLLHLSLAGTKIIDFSSLSKLKKLKTLSLEGTLIDDLTPLSGLASLEGLSVNNTSVADLTPIAKLTSLKRLRINNTKVADLGPIEKLLDLEGLSIQSTNIANLDPIARMIRLVDAAFEPQNFHDAGLYFSGALVAKSPPFDLFGNLAQPGLTIEVVNEVRRRNRLAKYIPIKPEEPDDEIEDHEQLTQKPASHSFAFRDGRIEAEPQAIPPRHPEVAADIRTEVSEKAKEVTTRLLTCNAPARVRATVSRLDTALGKTLDEVRAGILQMRFRSLEADLMAYDTDEGRKELPEDAFAMLRDLASSVEDLMGCFPQLADIEAERLAQRLKEVDVPKIMDALSQIRQVAEASDAVAPSAIEALKAGEPELRHNTEIIDSGAGTTARTAAAKARDKTVGYMLLVYRNFIAGTVKAATEIGGLGGDTWRGFRKKAPEQFSDAGVSLIIAALVNALLGPTAAVGAFAVSFKPLRDRAKRIADRLIALRKRAHEADDVGEPS